MATTFGTEFLRKSAATIAARLSPRAAAVKKTATRPSTIIPLSFSPLQPASIKFVDPQTMETQPIEPPANRTNTATVKKIRPAVSARALAVAAGAATVILPTLAYGATGFFAAAASFVSGLGLLSTIGLGFGLYYTGRLLYSEFQAMRNRNLQSKKMEQSFANPTPRKLFRTLVLPAWIASTAVGGVFTFFPAIDWTLANPGITGLVAFAALAFVPTLTILTTVIRDTYQWLRFKNPFNLFKMGGVQRNLKKEHIVGQLATDIYKPAAWLATVSFMAHLSKVYATQFIGMGFNFLSNLPTTFTSLSGVSAMGEYGLVFAAALGLLRFVLGWRRASIGQFADEVPSRLRSTLKAALLGLALGAFIYLAGPGLFVTNLLTFAVTLAFAHSTIHSTMSQIGGLRQANKKHPIFDLESLWESVRGRNSGTRTVFKPSIAMVDPLISSYVMVLVSEGANWVLNALTGAYVTKDYKEAQEMIEKLLKKDAQIMRSIIQNGYRAVMAAADTRAASQAMVDTYERLANLLDELADGNLRTRSGGLNYLKDSTFSAGLPGASETRSDQDLRVHGEHLHEAARINQAKAEVVRAMPVDNVDLASLQNVYREILEGLFRRANPPMDTHPVRFYHNFLPDSYNAKQFAVDNFQQIMSDFVGYMEVPVMTADGRIRQYAVPMKVVKDFREDHTDVMAIESRDTAGEDLRFGWYEREEHDIGDSLCDIAYIDNSAHFRKYQALQAAGTISDAEFLKLYPTAEVPAPPALRNEPMHDPYSDQLEDKEFYDVVYKNGARLRIYADGSQRTIGRLADGAPAVLMLPGTERHSFVGRMLGSGHGKVIFGDITVDADLGKVMAQGNIPHPFGNEDVIKADVVDIFGKTDNSWHQFFKNPSAPLLTFKPDAEALINTKIADAGKKEKLISLYRETRLYFNANKYNMPRWHFMYPTEYFSISDADQMDIIVTDLRLNHTRKNPHLRVMMVRPRTEDLPYSPDMLEEAHDSFLEVGVAIVWMNMKVTLRDGRQLYIPLNRNKENERTFGGELWRYIDEGRPVEIVRRGNQRFLKIPYRASASKDPAFREAVSEGLMLGGKYNNRESIEYVPVPLEMNSFVDDVADIRINPERYGDVGGPRPMADYFFMRRNAAGLVTDQTRQLEMTDRLANMLMFGKISLLSHREVEHWELVMKGLGKVEETDQLWTEESPREILPWVDKDGWVHMKLSEKEHQQLRAWIPEYFGKQRPVYENGELRIFVKHFEDLCETSFTRSTYRRFMPDHKFRIYWDSAEATLATRKRRKNNGLRTHSS